MVTGMAFRMACAAVMLAWFSVGTGFAQPSDKRTFFTFSGPVAIPGVTLPAGQYLFRIADTSSRNVVQVLSSDGKTPYAMFFALREERSDIPPDPEVRFMETASGMPSAVATWWYPGERTGYEFIYPKEQARLLAKGVPQPVLTTQVETSTVEQTKMAALERFFSSGNEIKLNADQPLPVFTPTGPAQHGQIAPSSIPVQAVAVLAQNARRQLPQTGSALPLVGLLGLAALLGGGASWYRRTART